MTDLFAFSLAFCVVFLSSSTGMGGGALLLPIYIFLLNLSTRNAVALSNFTIFCSSMANFFINSRKSHPLRSDSPLVAYDIILLFEPITVLGTRIGGFANKLFPPTLTITCMFLLLAWITRLTYRRGVKTYQKETELQGPQGAPSLGPTVQSHLPHDASPAGPDSVGPTSDAYTRPPLFRSITQPLPRKPAAASKSLLAESPGGPLLPPDAPPSPADPPSAAITSVEHPAPASAPEPGDVQPTVTSRQVQPFPGDRPWSQSPEGPGLGLGDTRSRPSDGVSLSFADRDLAQRSSSPSRLPPQGSRRSSGSPDFRGFPRPTVPSSGHRGARVPAHLGTRPLEAMPESSQSLLEEGEGRPDVQEEVAEVEDDRQPEDLTDLLNLQIYSSSGGASPLATVEDLKDYAPIRGILPPPVLVYRRAASSPPVPTDAEYPTSTSPPAVQRLGVIPDGLPEVDYTLVERWLYERKQGKFFPFELIVPVLLFCWFMVLTDVAKGWVPCGSAAYWATVLSALVPVGVVWAWSRRYLLEDTATRARLGVQWFPGDIQWDERNTLLFPLLCTVAGVMAGAFGIGGGIVKGPLMLELGVLPAVASATSASMILLTTASASAVFIGFGLLPWRFALQVATIGLTATFLGQTFLYGLVARLRRPSLIVFSMTLLTGLATILIGVRTWLMWDEILRGEKQLKWGKLCT